MLWLTISQGWKTLKLLKKRRTYLEFSNEHLFAVTKRPWFAEMTNFKVENFILNEFTWY